MRKTFILHNVFGDLPQHERIQLNFAPDLISPEVTPLAELTLLETTQGDVVRRLLPKAEPIPEGGLRQELRVMLRPGEIVKVVQEHWTWATKIGNSGFALSRFSERTRVVVRNRSRVTARICRPEDPCTVVSLAYGEEETIRDKPEVPEMFRLDFSWLPPVEFPEQAPVTGNELHPILQPTPLEPA